MNSIDVNRSSFDVVATIIEEYNDVMERKRDRRMDVYPLMSSPLVPLCLCLTYVWIVRGIGPRIMKTRPPLQFRSIMVAYNALQIVLSVVIFYMALSGGWLRRYSYKCQPVDYSDTFQAHQMVRLSWLYYFSKFTEFFDTFFFVLRKKFDHISVLHVVHHGLMPFSVWWGARFFPGGHSTFFGFINAYVHIVMYTYYMIAAMGQQYQHLIWWKRYLTTFQMVQFVAVGVHSFQLFFRECEFPTASSVYIGAHGLLYLALFANFYVQEYVRRKHAKKVKMDNIPNELSSSAEAAQKISAKPTDWVASRFGSTVANRRLATQDFDNGNTTRSP